MGRNADGLDATVNGILEAGSMCITKGSNGRFIGRGARGAGAIGAVVTKVLYSGCVVSIVAVIVGQTCATAIIQLLNGFLTRALQGNVVCLSQFSGVLLHTLTSKTYLINPECRREKVQVLDGVFEGVFHNFDTAGTASIELPIRLHSRDNRGAKLCHTYVGVGVGQCKGCVLV